MGFNFSSRRDAALEKGVWQETEVGSNELDTALRFLTIEEAEGKNHAQWADDLKSDKGAKQILEFCFRETK